MPAEPFDPTTEARFVEDVLAERKHAVVVFEKRIACVAGFLRGLNARRGRPFRDHDLEDIGQDIKLLALRKLPDYRPLAPLEHWLFRLCCNEFLNALRRRERHRRRRAEADVGELPAVPVAEPNVHDEVHQGLERVGGIEADCIRLKHFDGLTFKEIAARTATHENTVKTRYYRGLARLEALLTDPRSDEESMS